jgi:hypothetical protein
MLQIDFGNVVSINTLSTSQVVILREDLKTSFSRILSIRLSIKDSIKKWTSLQNVTDYQLGVNVEN